MMLFFYATGSACTDSPRSLDYARIPYCYEHKKFSKNEPFPRVDPARAEEIAIFR